MLIPYKEKTHGTFDDEWLRHRGVNDWWYVTGYLRDAGRPENLYSYQFTLINPRHFRKAVYVLHLAFTDIQTGKHFFQRNVRLTGKKTTVDQETIAVLPLCRLKKNSGDMILTARTGELALDLVLNLGKGAFWHGDRGVMVMGLPDDPVQRTVYYSYTNMPTSGHIRFTDNTGQPKELTVTGKSWFDRQWGPFHLFNTASYWEWFSIRFFDDDEVMLFAFPQHPYHDGTFIEKDGKNRRLFNYQYSYHRLKQNGKTVFSHGWDINLPGIKDENYRILPMNEEQYNGGYYEIMARVIKTDGTEVGYCFVELLPGVRQDGKKLNSINLIFSQLHG